MAAPIVISILANASQANSTLNKTSGILGKVGKAGKLMALGAGVGLVALGAAAKDFAHEANEARRVSANTNQVIKATGGVAGVTAKHVDSLTAALSKKTGTDDEAIASGANLLLTFKNIKKQGGIFDRAVAGALDLKAAGFGDIAGGAKTLGKALNDPIKGVSALGKQGVTFSQVQKDQIANFVKTNKMAKAQALILGEVESQVGGQAAAQATAGDRLAVTIGNIKEEIGAKLLPILDQAATYLNNKLPGWIANAGAAFTSFQAFIAPVVETVRGFFAGFDSGSGATSGKLAELQATVSAFVEYVKSSFTSLVSIATSLWAMFGDTLTSYASASLSNVLAVLRGTFDVISGIFKTIAAVLKGDWRGAWDGIKQIVKGALTVVGGLVREGMNLVSTVIKLAKTAIIAAAKGAIGGIADGAKAGWAAGKAYINSIPGKITDVFSGASTLLSTIGGQIVDGLTAGIRAAAGKVADAVDAIVSKIPKAIRSKLGIASPSKVTTELGKYVAQGLAVGMLEGEGDIRSAVLNLANIVNDDLPKKIKKPKAIREWYREHTKAIAEGSREVLATLKAKAAERLAALKAQQTEYANAVTSAARQYAGLGSMTLGENETVNVGGITQFYADRLAAINNFNAKLAAIKGRVSNEVYDQIVQMGVQQGTAYAEALAGASPEALAQVNALAGQISTASAALGASTAATMYASGVQSAQGFYDGLQSMLKKIQAQGVKIAKALVKELRKALDINSPSRVMRGIGKYSVEGLDQGLDTSRIQDKGRDLARSLVKGYASPQLDAQFTAGVRNSADFKATKTGDTYNTFHVTVEIEAGMSKAEQGRKIHEALMEAQSIGLVPTP